MACCCSYCDKTIHAIVSMTYDQWTIYFSRVISMIMVLVGILLSIFALFHCQFLTVPVTIIMEEEADNNHNNNNNNTLDTLVGISDNTIIIMLGIGLFQYTTTTGLDDDGECYPYHTNDLNDPSETLMFGSSSSIQTKQIPPPQTARILAILGPTLAMVGGLLLLVVTTTTTVCCIQHRHGHRWVVLTWLAALFCQGLTVLSLFGDDHLCSNNPNGRLGKCRISTGGVLAMMASICYLLATINLYALPLFLRLLTPPPPAEETEKYNHAAVENQDLKNVVLLDTASSSSESHMSAHHQRELEDLEDDDSSVLSYLEDGEDPHYTHNQMYHWRRTDVLEEDLFPTVAILSSALSRKTSPSKRPDPPACCSTSSTNMIVEQQQEQRCITSKSPHHFYSRSSSSSRTQHYVDMTGQIHGSSRRKPSPSPSLGYF